MTTPNFNEADSEASLHGTILDIVVFFLVLALTWVLGTVHGCLSRASRHKGHGGQTANGLREVNGRWISGSNHRARGSPLQMTRSNSLSDLAFVFTVLVAFAFISGLPSQIYFRGALGVVFGGVPAVILALGVVVLVYLPLFSSQENPFADWKDYLRLRFESRSVLFLTMALLAILWIIFAACAVYTLSLIFVQILGLKHSLSVMLVVLISTFFVVVEGKCHILITDFVLSSIVCVGIVVILALGFVENGGLSSVIEAGVEADDINPEAMDSALGVFSSQIFLWTLLFGIFYSSDDRYAKMHSSSGVLPLLVLNLPLAIFMVLLCVALGLISLSYFPPRCTAQELVPQWPDQIITKMITQKIGPTIPGFSGLFLSGVFALVLSLISTGFNFITGTFWSSLTKTSACLASDSDGPMTMASTPGAEAQRQVSTRMLSAFGCLFSGILAVALQGKIAFGIGIATSGMAIGVVVGIFFCGLFLPYVSARGTVVASLLTLLLGHWISVGGIVRQASLSGRLSPMENEMGCFGNLTVLQSPGGLEPRFDSPHTPIQSSGRIIEKSAPSFLIPQRPKDSSGNGHNSRSTGDAGSPSNSLIQPDHSLPRSPISNGPVIMPQAYYVLSPPMARPLALSSTGSAPNSPHLPSSSSSSFGSSGTGRIMPPNIATNSGGAIGAGNKPPLVLSKPESEGEHGYRFEDSGRQRASFHGLFEISYHYYAIISFTTMVIFSLIFSIRLCAQCQCQNFDDDSENLGRRTWVSLDPRLIHPIARMLCCQCCRQRVAKPEVALHFNMEKRRSQMMAGGGIEDFNGHHLRHDSQNSRRRISAETGGSQNSNNHERHDISRRCSRHSHMSKRSSLAGHGPITTTTQADVLVTVNPSQSPLATKADIERRLSQLSDNDVGDVVAVAMDQVSRRNSNSSSYHRRLSPQVSLNVVPPSVGHSPLGSMAGLGGSHLAPPTAEMLAQRRYSEVSAAIERHNSRRQAKRSQSVMYRQKRHASRRDSEIPNRSVSPPDFADYRRKTLQGSHSTPLGSVAMGKLSPNVIPTISTMDQM